MMSTNTDYGEILDVRSKKDPEKEPKADNGNISDKIVVSLTSLLKDVAWIDSMMIDGSTCATLIDVIDELKANNGKLSTGRKSTDGFVMHSCPKHDNAPIHLCIDCEFWQGGRKPSGSCISPDGEEHNSKYDTLEKFKFSDAKKNEIAYRREHGRYFAD